MTSGAKRKRIYIHITTYRPQNTEKVYVMDEKGQKKCYKGHTKYVCAICLNSKTEENELKPTECCKKVSKCCPICQKTKEKECNGNKKDKETVTVEKEEPIIITDSNAKTVQTSDTNVTNGLTLLNEVLTVFQNKKVDINKDKVKSILLRDVAVSTDENGEEKQPKDQTRLTVSTFQYSIDDAKKVSYENGKFTIVNCCQPDFVRNLKSIDLIKHKSSSIPQMKLEELKYSLKEKSRSKDAIEEVNRMFATVRKPNKGSENSNRPVVRNGPRVLPVVKSNYPDNNKRDLGTECNYVHNCKYCQTCMSSGDCGAKAECCDTEAEKCDKCVYMLCCHYENKRKMQSGVLLCEHCRDLNEEQLCQHSFVDDSG